MKRLAFKKRHSKRLPVFIGYMLTYSVIFLLPFIILGLYFFGEANHRIEENAESIFNRSLEHLSSEVSTCFDDITNIMFSIHKKDNYAPENRPLLPCEWKDSRYNRTQISWRLRDLTKNNPLIENCILYYHNYNTVFTASTNEDIDIFLEARFQVKAEKDIKELLKNTNKLTFIPVELTDPMLGKTSRGILWIFPITIENNSTHDASLAFFINEGNLLSLAKRILENSEFRLGILYSSMKPPLIFGSYEGAPENMTIPRDSTVIKEKYNGRAVYIAQTPLNIYGYKLVLEAPLLSEFQQLDSFQNLTVKLLSITLTAGVILMLIASYVNYAPLKRILRTLGASTHIPSKADRKNEYHIIVNAIKDSFDENRKLESIINRQSEAFFSQVLYELLSDNIKYDYLDRTIDVKIRLPGPVYLVFAVHSVCEEMAKDDVIRLFESEQPIETNYAIINMPQYRSVAVVLCVQDIESAKRFTEFLTQKQQNQTNVSIGISNAYDNIRMLSRLMLEAYLALDSMLANGLFGVCAYSEEIASAFTVTPPSSRLLEDFCCHIKNGNGASAVQAFREMMVDISSDVNPLRMRIQINHIISSTLNLVQEIDPSCSIVIVELSRCFVHYDNSINVNAQEFSERFAPILISICEHVKKVKENESVNLYRQMVSYIDEHYLDYDFSLDKLASVYSISASSLSTAFKHNVGMGFVEYLTQKKMNIARHLLLTTKDSVREISQYVGYSNESYFIRVFRNAHGMTPAQYRKQYDSSSGT
ncbi:MAG: helix-turn-helix transcriptional regulator [Clostridia bacterium]|nr:helix-turn-helix transcriptional regulator [Clostridia bacterium]